MKKILLVDDEQFNIDALKIMIRRFTAYDPDEFCDIDKNGIQCIELIEKDIERNDFKYCSYSIVLMDQNMPFMDGCQASKKLREILYARDIAQPIISAVTGHTE